VPTGNFGDILAGYYAKQMGLPIEQLVIATNKNDILHRFFNGGGDYSLDAGGVHETLAPSMDIGVSSNFERFLFHMTGDDTAAMKALMDTFESSGTLNPPASLVEASRAVMDAASVTDSEILATVADVHQRADGYTLDPHSAIGVAAARKARAAGTDAPMVCLACAHWAKFPDATKKGLGAEAFSALQTPEPLASLKSLPTRVKSQPYDVETIKGFIRETLAARA